MNRKAVAGLVAMISVGAAGFLISQETTWHERGNTTQASTSQLSAMLDRQLRGRGISDPRTLRAMASVAREKFVPPELRARAYDDRPLPIGYGQTISQPYIVALMTEQIRPKPGQRVLEIGTGSGYQAAVLSELVAEVYSIEIVRPLAQRAEGLLRELGYKNVHVKAGDGYKGWPEHAPFDAIIVTAAPDHVPKPLIEQLREGGRMIIPVGESRAQNLYLLEKRDGLVKQTAVIPVKFVPFTRDP
ncbi:MAG TPA: protein-L-isoaspartate(D-aspartate) O-methyltransferase [Chthoniobacterales bacterium]|nr:protein-L-isoaspartate(D-aspartate) O-methyltransferase [Chthoniobacterales bacterium]